MGDNMDSEVHDLNHVHQLFTNDCSSVASSDLDVDVNEIVENVAVPALDTSRVFSRVFNHNHNVVKETGEDLSGFSYELRHALKIVCDLMSDAHKGVNAPFLVHMNRAQHIDDMDDYRQVIKNPIWLGKIKEKIFAKAYETITEVVSDVRLMLENCYRYHGPDTTFSKKGLKMEQILEQKLNLLPREIRDKTTLKLTCGYDTEDILGPRRRSTRNSLDYTSVIFNRVRDERALRNKEQRKKITEVKKAEKEVKEKGVVEWENTTLLAEPLKTQMKAMWELPLIGHFLFLCRTVLNIHEVSIYELERILIMPRASTLLSRIMTSLLSNPHQRVNMDRRPVMPYKVWQNRLQGRVQSWYKIRQARDYRSDLVFQQLGIEADFFKIMGPENPLLEKKFHELAFHQRVWLVKSLCDYVLQSHKTIQDTLNEQTMEDLREYVLGCDSDGNAYLHFPQFCGLDLRIYRQAKTNRVPAPHHWGAISTNKRKQDEFEDDSIQDQNVKKIRSESPNSVSIEDASFKSQSPEPPLNVEENELLSYGSPKPPLLEDETKLPIIYYSLPNEDDDSRLPPTLQDETKTPPLFNDPSLKDNSPTPPILEEEEMVTTALDHSSRLPTLPNDECLVSEHSKPRRKIEKPLNNYVTSPVWNTRRSLRLTPARLAIMEVNYKENNSSSSENDDSDNDSDWSSNGSSVKEKITGIINEEDEFDVESDNEETSLEPDIIKFELVVDSVEALRKLLDDFSAKLESVCLNSTVPDKKSVKVPPRHKCELQLRDRLMNLLNELEPWEPKLQKATQRLRLKLKREWDDFNEREEEVDDDDWASDRDEEVSSVSEENSSVGDDRCPPYSDSQKSSISSLPNHSIDDIDEMAASMLADLGEYRTRSRIKQMRNMKIIPTKLNGIRHDHNELIRNLAKQNTVSQAKELYAWETLRQILVPSGSSTPPDVTILTSPSTSSSSNLDLNTTVSQLNTDKKCFSKAELDILGAINEATSLVKKRDPVVSPKTMCVRTFENIRKLGTSIVVPKSGITKPAGFVVHIPISGSSSVNVSAASATVMSTTKMTVSASEFLINKDNRESDSINIPTNKKLSDLSLIVTNKETLGNVLNVVSSGNPSRSLVGSSVSLNKTSDGKVQNVFLTRLASCASPVKTISTATNIPQSPLKFQINAETSNTTGQQTVLLPVSNHQGQTVYIRVPSGATTSIPTKVTTYPITSNTLSSPIGNLPRPPPLEPIRGFVKNDLTSTQTRKSSLLVEAQSPRICRPITTTISSNNSLSPSVTQIRTLTAPPRLLNRNVVNTNNNILRTKRVTEKNPSKIPQPINIPANLTTSNSTSAVLSTSTSDVASVHALLSSNNSVAMAVQKLTTSGHKVLISQQLNGNVVLQASPQTPTMIASPPRVNILSQTMPATSISFASSSDSTVKNCALSLGTSTNSQINVSSPTKPLTTQSQTNSVSQGLLQIVNTSSASAGFQQQASGAQTSIKSKLVMIHDPNTKKQSFGLLLDNGQVLPVNTTLSLTNNSVKLAMPT